MWKIEKNIRNQVHKPYVICNPINIQHSYLTHNQKSISVHLKLKFEKYEKKEIIETNKIILIKEEKTRQIRLINKITSNNEYGIVSNRHSKETNGRGLR